MKKVYISPRIELFVINAPRLMSTSTVEIGGDYNGSTIQARDGGIFDDDED